MLIFTVAGILLIGALLAFSKLQADIYEPGATLNLPGKEISIIEVKTPEARTRGLSGMKSLPEDSAMLFTFDQADEHGIWMKDMNFSIDIFWLDERYKVVHIEENVSPDTFPAVFYPKQKALYVLEANAGFAEKYTLKTGQILQPATTK